LQCDKVELVLARAKLRVRAGSGHALEIANRLERADGKTEVAVTVTTSRGLTLNVNTGRLEIRRVEAGTGKGAQVSSSEPASADVAIECLDMRFAPAAKT